MKIINFIFYSFFIVLLLAVAALFLAPQLPFVDNFTLKIVESGSMEPAITTGSLVAVYPAPTYSEGDVITFRNTYADVPTTHRIVEVREVAGEQFFMTKGDANEEADTEEASERAVLGRVVVAIPYVGFILDFARQPLGFMLLIVVPAGLIILSEIEKIWQEARKRRRKTSTEKNDEDNDVGNIVETFREVGQTSSVRMMDIACPTYVPMRRSFAPVQVQVKTAVSSEGSSYLLSAILILSSVLFTGMGFIGGTVSYLNDIESTVINTLKASLVDFVVLVDSPSYTFTSLDDLVTFTTTITPDTESLVVDYTVTIEKVAGDDIFCEAISAAVDVPITYTGALLGLSATGVIFTESWDLSLTLDPLAGEYAAGSTCAVDVVYTAWYKDGPAGVGYSDTERVSLTLSTQIGNDLSPVAPLFEREIILPPEELSELFEAAPKELDALRTEENIPINPAAEFNIPEEVETIVIETNELKKPVEALDEDDINENTVIEGL